MSMSQKIFAAAIILFVVALITNSIIVQAIGWAVLIAGWVVLYKEYKSYK